MVLAFLGKTYATDDLCTWALEHQRSNGIQDLEVTQNICDWIECLFIPNEIFITGYALAGISYVSGFIIGGLIFDTILLGAWFATDPFQWTIKVVSEDTSELILSAHGECYSESPNFWIWPLAILAVHFSFLIYGNFLAYQTRHCHRISDSICLFNSIQLLLVASVMLALSGDNVAISYYVRASYAFLNNVGVLFLIVGPKLYLCITGRGDIMPEVGKTTSRASASDSQSPMKYFRTEYPLMELGHQMTMIDSMQATISDEILNLDDLDCRRRRQGKSNIEFSRNWAQNRFERLVVKDLAAFYLFGKQGRKRKFGHKFKPDHEKKEAKDNLHLCRYLLPSLATCIRDPT
jgi:hypothetical protein